MRKGLLKIFTDFRKKNSHFFSPFQRFYLILGRYWIRLPKSDCDELYTANREKREG